MVLLTRLNNQQIAVNSDLIKFVESKPDTVITLITGEKILVQERVDEVIARVTEFRRKVLPALNLGHAGSSSSAHASPDPRSRQDDSRG